jgi:hypothetical protein
LQLLCKYLTVDLLRSFPTTCKHYFSFLSMGVSGFEAEFARIVAGTEVS